MIRHRLPNNRWGRTHKVQIGSVEVYITVNRGADGSIREVFGHCTDGFQPYLEDCCIPSSLALQYGCLVETLVDKLLHRRGYPPIGAIGQPKSLSDAIGCVLRADQAMGAPAPPPGWAVAPGGLVGPPEGCLEGGKDEDID